MKWLSQYLLAWLGNNTFMILFLFLHVLFDVTDNINFPFLLIDSLEWSCHHSSFFYVAQISASVLIKYMYVTKVKFVDCMHGTSIYDIQFTHNLTLDLVTLLILFLSKECYLLVWIYSFPLYEQHLWIITFSFVKWQYQLIYVMVS